MATTVFGRRAPALLDSSRASARQATSARSPPGNATASLRACRRRPARTGAGRRIRFIRQIVIAFRHYAEMLAVELTVRPARHADAGANSAIRHRSSGDAFEQHAANGHAMFGIEHSVDDGGCSTLIDRPV